MRTACLWIAELPLVAVLRAEPALAGSKLAVVQPAAEGASSRQRVLGATHAAEGVVAGQTLSEAQALCPDLLVRTASTALVKAAAQAALDAATSVTPRLEEQEPGLIFLDVSGLASLLGDDAAVACALLRGCARVGLCAAVGLAEGKIAALLAARSAGSGAFKVVLPGEQAAFLAGIPVAQAEVSGELAAASRRFGIATLGELARLPRKALAARLGPEGAALHRIASGHDDSHLVAREQPERFEEGCELDFAASTLEPLLFLWKALLDRLCARLAVRGLAAAELSLLLRLEGGAWDERRIELAAPAREVAPLLALLRLEVEARPPPEGVCAVRLSALPARAVQDQLGLFGPRTASPAQLSSAVARIAALVGPERVGEPVAPETHRPNAAALAKFAPPPAPLFAAAADPAALQPISIATRALRPPRTVDIRCDEDGRPRLVIGEKALGGRVLASAGPWRTVAEWWTSAPLSLDSWDLELAGGLLLRASRELDSGAWWIESVYD